ncbi:NAD(P)/FAD-dependent oxidoreductase [Desulfosarcina variabilis]|uniref:NAD(P)/FAD-dependent oxidoreductase n=1 Tax=Desulfosarcina variabilis TaxID=2300 RepID=UPI003AFB737D
MGKSRALASIFILVASGQPFVNRHVFFDKVMGPLLDPEIAYHVHNEFAANGIALKLSERVVKIDGDDRGNVTRVITDKAEYPADMVLIAVGVRPNIQMARDMGLEIGETGAIKVDDRMRTSDPDIYAGGDCVENISRITSKPIYAAMDNIITTANIAENKLNGLGKSYAPMEVKANLDNNDDFIRLPPHLAALGRMR